MQAGTTQGRIRDDHPRLRSKRLQNDILIVCTARRIGTLIITDNGKDFALIRSYLPHRALTVGEAERLLVG